MIREISEVLLLNLSGFLRLLDALLEHMISTVFLDIDGDDSFLMFYGKINLPGKVMRLDILFFRLWDQHPMSTSQTVFFSFEAIPFIHCNIKRCQTLNTCHRPKNHICTHTHTKRGHSPYNCQWWWSCPITRQRLWPQAATTFWPWTSQARKSKTAHNLAFYRQKDRHVCPKTVRNATKHWLTTAVKKLRKRVS